ncbi:MAG: Gfo/Idh/MocA family oxidoreductase [Rubripirellula sp.]|nr:oxidoreductase [Rhodopirellula sp.]MCH1440285.1 Gfo/Idh/MocA family oxidoreductase [Rubripirellula sp.]OUX06728.1 MAG: oxidoreductase [Planctomycetaceae bacterium TMED240]
MSIKRRHFIQSAAAVGTLAATPAIHARKNKAKRYRTALIGSGWWGMNILKEALAAENIQVVALCDVDSDKVELAAEEVEDLTGHAPNTYGDFRELLEKEEVEIAIVATPDHWHALNTIAAIEAGAHIFVEKPTGHTIAESRAMLEAARANDRVVQVGMHRRIGPHYVSGMKFLKDGGAGDIGMVKAFVHNRGGAELPTPNSAPPEQLDWKMYCGPAPMRPFNRKIHPGGFRHFLDFANGTLGDWGVHWLDQILWWTEEKYPKQIHSVGGRPVKGPAVMNQTHQTTDAPDHQVATYQFESFTAYWEHRRFGGTGPQRSSVGCHFYGTKGTFHMGWRDGWTFYPADSKKAPIHQDAVHKEPDGHSIDLLWADFVDAIETGRRPTCDVQIGHDATNMSLLGMLSMKLGRSVIWDGAREQIVGDEEANVLLRRPYHNGWKYPGTA